MDLKSNIAYSLEEKKDQNITHTLTLQEGLKRALLKFNEERPIFFLKKKQVLCIVKIYLQCLFSGPKIVLLTIMYVIPIKTVFNFYFVGFGFDIFTIF